MTDLTTDSLARIWADLAEARAHRDLITRELEKERDSRRRAESEIVQLRSLVRDQQAIIDRLTEERGLTQAAADQIVAAAELLRATLGGAV